MKIPIAFIVSLIFISIQLTAQDGGVTELEYYSSLMSSYKYEDYKNDLKCDDLKNPKKIKWGTLSDLPNDIRKNIEYQYNRKNSNFANCYRIVVWGCGSPCQMLAVFDSNSGELLGTLNASLGFEYKAGSTLILANPPTDEPFDRDYRNRLGAAPQFYELKNGEIRKVQNKPDE